MTTDSNITDLEASLAEYSGPGDDKGQPGDPGQKLDGEPPPPADETPPADEEKPKKDDEDLNVPFTREVDAIDAKPGFITLENGTEVKIIRLKTREFFRLMRIVTHGAMPALMSMQVDFDLDDEAFMNRLLTVVLMAVPESEQETVDFIQGMCEPVGLHTGRKLTKTQIQENADKQIALDDLLSNPELSDTISIVEAVIKQEAEDIKALGKRLSKMWDLAVKTGQVPKADTSVPSEKLTQDDS